MIRIDIKCVFLVLAMLVFAACNRNAKSTKQDEPLQDPVLTEFNKKIKNNPNDASLYVQKADYLIDKGDIPEALLLLISAVDIDSTSATAWSRLSDVYMTVENFSGAEDAMIKSMKLDPNSDEILVKLAKYYLIFVNYDDARIYLKRALDQNPLNAQAFYILGTCEMEQGDTAKAILNFNRSLELNPELYESYMVLALIYETRNDPMAVDYYRNAIAIRPNYLPAKYALAYYYQEKLEEEDEALKMYDAILQVDPLFYDALYNKGYIYLVYKKDPETALDFFKQAAEVSSQKNPDVIYNIGFCLEKMGKTKEARAVYQSVLEIFPDYQLAIQGLNRVGRF